MQERLRKLIERRESVMLKEMLRTAKMMKRRRRTSLVVMECWILGERRRVLERRVLEILRRDGQRQQVKLESPDPLGQLDSTEEVSCLSTIMEESEMISPTLSTWPQSRMRVLSLPSWRQTLRGGSWWRRTSPP